MKPDGAEWAGKGPPLVVFKPVNRWHRASGVSMLLAPADPVSAEPRFGNYTRQTPKPLPADLASVEARFANFHGERGDSAPAVDRHEASRGCWVSAVNFQT